MTPRLQAASCDAAILGDVTQTLALLQTTDDDFARMLAHAPALVSGSALPPKGIEAGGTLAYLRALAARLERDWFRAAWSMVAGNEVVGLIGFKAPPTASGEVEIGYGVALERRRLGHASAAVALVVELAAARDDIRVILAETVPGNVASHRVLERNGFERCGTRISPEDGDLILWRRVTKPEASLHFGLCPQDDRAPRNDSHEKRGG